MILSPARQKMSTTTPSRSKMCNNHSASLFGLTATRTESTTSSTITSRSHGSSSGDTAAAPPNATTGGSGGGSSERSLFGSLKRDRSQRSSTTLSGSHKSLSGFLNDARTAAVATCNAVFSEFGHSPPKFGVASTSSFFSAPSVHSASTGSQRQEDPPAPANRSTTEVMTQLHRSSDSIFLSTDTSRRGSITAPPPRKGRRRMSDEDEGRNGGENGILKVMSSPALTQFDIGPEEDSMYLAGHSYLSPPLNDAAAAATAAAAGMVGGGGGGGMSLSDGEDAIVDFLQKQSKAAPCTTPMNSPSNSNVKRVQSMPVLAAHDAMSEDDEAGAPSSTSVEAKHSGASATDFAIPPDTNPDEFLRTIMGSMGYPSEPVDTLSVANLFHEHTPEQIAAYDNETCGAARSDDLDALRRLWRAGKTLQCSNRFGESLIHIACRRGSLPVIAFLLDEAGVSIRVRDDCGRTPLHDACWASHPNFEVIQMLIEREPDFLMLCDKRGHTPLAYVRREKWGDWCRFLSENRAMLTPKGNILTKNMDM